MSTVVKIDKQIYDAFKDKDSLSANTNVFKWLERAEKTTSNYVFNNANISKEYIGLFKEHKALKYLFSSYFFWNNNTLSLEIVDYILENYKYELLLEAFISNDILLMLNSKLNFDKVYMEHCDIEHINHTPIHKKIYELLKEYELTELCSKLYNNNIKKEFNVRQVFSLENNKELSVFLSNPSIVISAKLHLIKYIMQNKIKINFTDKIYNFFGLDEQSYEIYKQNPVSNVEIENIHINKDNTDVFLDYTIDDHRIIIDFYGNIKSNKFHITDKLFDLDTFSAYSNGIEINGNIFGDKSTVNVTIEDFSLLLNNLPLRYIAYSGYGYSVDSLGFRSRCHRDRHSSTAVLKVGQNVTVDFDSHASSEARYDYSYIYVVDSDMRHYHRIYRGSGGYNRHMSVAIKTGQYLILYYSKDGSVSRGHDSGWINNIKVSSYNSNKTVTLNSTSHWNIPNYNKPSKEWVEEFNKFLHNKGETK